MENQPSINMWGALLSLLKSPGFLSVAGVITLILGAMGALPWPHLVQIDSLGRVCLLLFGAIFTVIGIVLRWREAIPRHANELDQSSSRSGIKILSHHFQDNGERLEASGS
jgi:hypothetical protein